VLIARDGKANVLSLIILTFNDEASLPQCLNSLAGLDCETFVVDAGSIDRTAEIARSFGATFVSHPSAGYAAQRNWAMDNLALRTPWVMHLEADERLSPELRASIAQAVAEPANRQGLKVKGFRVKTSVVFMGRTMRHGGQSHSDGIRLHQLGKAQCTKRRDESRFIVEVDGATGDLEGELIRAIAGDLTSWIAACNRRSELEAGVVRAPDVGAGYRPWFFIRALCNFLWCYCIRLGFLDGREGLLLHLYHAVYVSWKYAKAWELSRQNTSASQPLRTEN